MMKNEEIIAIMEELKEEDRKALEYYKKTLDVVSFTMSIFINYILDDIKFIEKIKPV